MDEERIDAVFGYAAAMGSVLESLIELLVLRGVIEAGLVIEAIDLAQWALDEQPPDRAPRAATAAAQRAALGSLLERLGSSPAFRVARRGGPEEPPASG
ncbi:MAG: hypothetical protein ACYC8V_09525 [Caulobacteraceae bacterium]